MSCNVSQRANVVTESTLKDIVLRLRLSPLIEHVVYNNGTVWNCVIFRLDISMHDITYQYTTTRFTSSKMSCLCRRCFTFGQHLILVHQYILCQTKPTMVSIHTNVIFVKIQDLKKCIVGNMSFDTHWKMTAIQLIHDAKLVKHYGNTEIW